MGAGQIPSPMQKCQYFRSCSFLSYEMVGVIDFFDEIREALIEKKWGSSLVYRNQLFY